MELDFSIYRLLGILGLLGIIIGNIFISSKKQKLKRYVYPLLLFGGICLEIYSIYIQDIIFIILQLVFIIVAIYGFIYYKNNKKRGKNEISKTS
ncbi:MAG TPA: hypothetical protein VJ912_03710 [Candidatus Nanoarchaeia archaeon]|nr:hypothetical protein [Candidatus Nanoarchaeia archaeon]